MTIRRLFLFKWLKKLQDKILILDFYLCTGESMNNRKKGVYMMEYRGYRNIYGYRTSTILDRHFVIDDRVASVVRQMFLWILDGKSIDEIAEYLNHDIVNIS